LRDVYSILHHEIMFCQRTCYVAECLLCSDLSTMVCHCFVHCIVCLTTNGFRLPCWRDGRVRLMVFDTTYNNISIIIWRSLLLVEETAVTGKPNELPQVTDKTLLLSLQHGNRKPLVVRHTIQWTRQWQTIVDKSLHSKHSLCCLCSW
jgi:hypothetical protein